ncbi:hypothetical protein [Hyalangium sp.]|uniref:hypothetical protein n=1 Tax=Hyalangium sp. TaxID=2028555 RepID=UPI002D3AA36D|nr:hypothetical protein [Hyalangium sp.]HYH96113.1 hypothetical protein [Hyalangium sp.]
MRGLIIHADDLLRAGTPSARHSEVTPRFSLLLTLIVVFGAGYGAAMGSYGGDAGFGGARPLQMFYSALKVPLLLLATFGLSLPSYFVINSLLGLREDLGVAVRALLATQACLTVVLCALAPLTLTWYASYQAYEEATLFNALTFAVASVSGQVLLRRLYRPLIARDVRHRALLRLWLIIYAFVGIQMGWLLRPFIGIPGAPTRFLREDTWSNAYVFIANRIWEVLTR